MSNYEKFCNFRGFYFHRDTPKENRVTQMTHKCHTNVTQMSRILLKTELFALFPRFKGPEKVEISNKRWQLVVQFLILLKLSLFLFYLFSQSFAPLQTIGFSGILFFQLLFRLGSTSSAAGGERPGRQARGSLEGIGAFCLQRDPKCQLAQTARWNVRQN
jgi:hypothetical protein